MKLAKLAVTDPMLSWFKSYLIERKQQVKINNSIFNMIDVTLGVPQGSHLSPVLFNIFINDLQYMYIFPNCKSLLFVDYLKLYSSINFIDDCKKLQNDLLTFENWCLINSLHINVSKCSQITFIKRKTSVVFNYFIKNKRLNIRTHIKYLSFILSSHLMVNEHITLICHKTTRIHFILNNIKLLY